MARESIHLPNVIAYLEAHGETRMNDLALGLGLSPATLYSAVATPLVKGDIVKRNEGRSVFYRLPGQEPMVRQPAAEAAEVEGTGPAGDDSLPEFQAAAWADGDVDLYGVIPLQDGGYRLTPAMVAKLKRLITWTPA